MGDGRLPLEIVKQPVMSSARPVESGSKFKLMEDLWNNLT